MKETKSGIYVINPLTGKKIPWSDRQCFSLPRSGISPPIIGKVTNEVTKRYWNYLDSLPPGKTEKDWANTGINRRSRGSQIVEGHNEDPRQMYFMAD